MTKFGLDYTNGVIIGDIVKTGQVFYEGRPQSQRFHADNDAGLRTKGKEVIDEWKRRCGEAYSMIYKNPEAWELRIWD